MNIGSPLEEASLEEVLSLPSDAVHGRIVILGNSVYVYKKGSAAYIELASSDSNGEVPIGTILPFYDYDGALSFDTDIYKYCDGSTISEAGSPINGETLPDLSNRYMVGFGTEGGGDIDTASWATAAVGNADHETDIGHVHAGGSHTHGVGTLKFKTFYATDNSGTWELWGWDTDGTAQRALSWTQSAADGVADYSNNSIGQRTYYTKDGSGVTAAGGTEDTASGGSATQDIQPRSIRVRYIMRVL